MTDCDICCNTYNKSTRSKVKCGKCQFECCKECVRTYLLGSIKNAHCLNCGIEWDRKFMVENLNGSFVTQKYKNHRSNILLDREKARLPETMPFVARRIKVRDLEVENSKLNDEISILKEKYRLLELKKRENDVKIRNILTGNEGGEEKRQHFHKACPADNCKGFLSTAYKCGICKIWACSKCFEIKGYNKDDEHTCKEENLKTAEMIKKETKNCPGCAATIYKINGCDQMFCTQCKIAFSWKTGEIETGVIHNPHFYEYQRQVGQNIRNPTEVPCGGIPGYWDFQNKIRYSLRRKEISQKLTDKVMNFHREANHWQHWEIRLLRRQCRLLEDNRGLRIEYLLNNITEHFMKNELIKREKSKNKKNSILHIYELMNTVFTESLIDIYNQTDQNNILMNFDRIEKLIDYSNKELARVSYVFGQTVKCFDKNELKLYSIKYTKKSYLDFLSEKSE